MFDDCLTNCFLTIASINKQTKKSTKKKQFIRIKNKSVIIIVPKFHLQCFLSFWRDNNDIWHYRSSIRYLLNAKAKKRLLSKWSDRLRLWSIHKCTIDSGRHVVYNPKWNDCLCISIFRRGCTEFELGNRCWYSIGKLYVFTLDPCFRLLLFWIFPMKKQKLFVCSWCYCS